MAIHASNSYNAEASINAWFRAAVNAYSWPAQFSAAPGVAIDEPDEVPDLPRFSLHHIPINRPARYQSSTATDAHKVTLAANYLEINIWVNRDEQHWRYQREQMRAFVEDLCIQTPVVNIQDYSDPDNPSSTAHYVTFGALDPQDTAPDPNEAIRRVRLLRRYDWYLYAAVS